jgi:hypothetical protein
LREKLYAVYPEILEWIEHTAPGQQRYVHLTSGPGHFQTFVFMPATMDVAAAYAKLIANIDADVDLHYDYINEKWVAEDEAQSFYAPKRDEPIPSTPSPITPTSDRSSIIPFNLIDFFAYLGSGFAFIAANVIMWSPKLSQYASFRKYADSPFFTTAVLYVPLLIFASYAVGQIIAHLSHLVLERGLAGKLVGHARAYALQGVFSRQQNHNNITRPTKIILACLFVSNYTRPLSAREVSTLQLWATGCSSAYALERLCLTNLNKSASRIADRLFVFEAIYTFCRNTSLALLLISIIAPFAMGTASIAVSLVTATSALLLIGRYLVFLRFYTDEIFTGFCSINGSSKSLPILNTDRTSV